MQFFIGVLEGDELPRKGETLRCAGESAGNVFRFDRRNVEIHYVNVNQHVKEALALIRKQRRRSKTVAA